MHNHWTTSSKLSYKHSSNVHNVVFVHKKQSVLSPGGLLANRRTTRATLTASRHKAASKTHKGRMWKVNTAISRGLVLVHEWPGPQPALPAPLPLPLPLKPTDLPSNRFAPPPSTFTHLHNTLSFGF